LWPTTSQRIGALHALVEQQVPSTQEPLTHSAAVTHAAPSTPF
jgi:hypothetical protein